MSYPNTTTSIIPAGMSSCAWCGPNIFHSGICPRVKAIDYHPGGAVAHVEFFTNVTIQPDEEAARQ